MGFEYDGKPVTLAEQKAMAKELGYYDQIKTGTSRWALYALTAVHGAPATHETARDAADKLARSITGNKDMAMTDTPRLHYARRDGKAGIASAFAGKRGAENPYHPRLIAKRTKIEGISLFCESGCKTRYDKCKKDCLVVVRINGTNLIDIVRGKKGKAKADKPKRTYTRKSKTSAPKQEAEAPKEKVAA